MKSLLSFRPSGLLFLLFLIASHAASAAAQADVGVTVNGTAAQVQYAGIAPGFVGLSQINVAIPPAGSGPAPVTVRMGGGPFRQTVQVWVK